MTQLDARPTPRDSDRARDLDHTRRTSAAQRLEGWRIPLVLGAILVCVGVFFVLVAHGLSTLAAIGS